MAPTERLTLRRQMAAAAGKKESTSLSLFLEVCGLDVEEELATVTTQAWAEGVWIGKRHTERKEVWRKRIFEVQTRTCRSCSVWDLCKEYENHDKNGYGFQDINKNFIMTNVDNSDTTYTNKNDTNNHNAHDLHK